MVHDTMLSPMISFVLVACCYYYYYTYNHQQSNLPIDSNVKATVLLEYLDCVAFYRATSIIGNSLCFKHSFICTG